MFRVVPWCTPVASWSMYVLILSSIWLKAHFQLSCWLTRHAWVSWHVLKGSKSKLCIRRKHRQQFTYRFIGEVICFDLKGPMVSRDLLGNRCIISFIDNRLKYFRVFLDQFKSVAALKFKYFLIIFERESIVESMCCDLNRGGEYKTLDVFCRATDVSRRLSKAKTKPGMVRLKECIVPSWTWYKKWCSLWTYLCLSGATLISMWLTLSSNEVQVDPGGVSTMELLT